MKNSMLPYWLAFMLIFAASYGGWKWYQVKLFEAEQTAGGIELSQPLLEDFELTERSGKTFRSADMQGKVWVTTFFFATCPGSCKRLNQSVRIMHNKEDLQAVTWLSITVDPKADTLEALNKYADGFKADPERWLFCRGDLEYIKRIGRDIMKLPITWKAHNEEAVVIDHHGVVRGMYDITSKKQSKKLADLLRVCLAEQAAEAKVNSSVDTKVETEVDAKANAEGKPKAAPETAVEERVIEAAETAAEPVTL